MRRPKALKYITITLIIAAMIATGDIFIDYLKEKEVKNALVVLDQSIAPEDKDPSIQEQGSKTQEEKNNSQEPLPDKSKQATNLMEEVKEPEIKKGEGNKAPAKADDASEKLQNAPSPKPTAEAPSKPKEQSQPVKEEPKESASAPEKSVVPEASKTEQPPKESINTSPTYLPNNYAFSYKEIMENEVIALVNSLRKENGLPALSYDSSLRESARYKSNSMLQHQYFSHSNPQLGGKSMSSLLWDVFNINSTRVGENIAYYQGPNEKITARQIYDQWYNSASHREAMLSTGFTRIGVGIVVSSIGDASSYMYGTQHFAK